MKEEHVFFTAGGIRLEGLYAESAGNRGCVISHPHPEMGGDMRNNVVDALVSAFSSKGFSTLRFNFRGVGKSEGIYDGGNAEQEDVIGAVKFLADKEKSEIVLAGYSFGAWITTKVIARHDMFSDIILVSPPIDFMKFDFTGLEGKIGLIICGDRDQFCKMERLTSIVNRIKCRMESVKGADHFYFGRESDIVEHLNQYVT